ncbi:MAG: ferredoxin [Rhodobacteraceae bacterium]|nr:ferredoxin [Paracoccaceae bacterium]
MSYSIDEIEGIGPVYAEKLQAVGIRTTEAYLERAKDPKGRKALAEETGIEASRILKWANMADLMRINGVGEEYSELLEAAGVDTVKELKHRNAANLAAKMKEVNEEKKLVRQVPGETSVEKWVEQAKALPAMMTY